MKSIFSEEQLEFIKLNYDKMTYVEIANLFGMTDKQVRNKARKLGLSKLRKFDKRYFEIINTNNKAYWLGFIYADGYLVNNNRSKELGIELKFDDKYILEKFNEELGNVHKIIEKHQVKNFNNYTYETHSALLRIYSKFIYEDLIDKNILPNKTNEKLFPTCNNEYFFDFLRGFLDGDGCISLNSKKNLLTVHFTNSNPEFLDYLNEKIESHLGIKGSIYKETDKKYKLYYFRKDDVKILLDKMYESSETKLIRKYEIYKSYYGYTS